MIVRARYSELANTHLASHTFKSCGNSVVFKKKNDAKLFMLKSYLAIKISFIRKLSREKISLKKYVVLISPCVFV